MLFLSDDVQCSTQCIAKIHVGKKTGQIDTDLLSAISADEGIHRSAFAQLFGNGAEDLLIGIGLKNLQGFLKTEAAA